MINSKLELEFENRRRERSERLSKKMFEPLLVRAGRVLKKNHGVITLVMVDDAAIKSLNKEFRGVDKATDVLSFSYFDGTRFPAGDVIGEILISVPTARRQARDHGKTLEQELQFLFVHGVLHVFGHDHQKPGERKKMFDLQDKILGNKSWRAIADREAEE